MKCYRKCSIPRASIRSLPHNRIPPLSLSLSPLLPFPIRFPYKGARTTSKNLIFGQESFFLSGHHRLRINNHSIPTLSSYPPIYLAFKCPSPGPRLFGAGSVGATNMGRSPSLIVSAFTTRNISLRFILSERRTDGWNLGETGF